MVADAHKDPSLESGERGHHAWRDGSGWGDDVGPRGFVVQAIRLASQHRCGAVVTMRGVEETKGLNTKGRRYRIRAATAIALALLCAAAAVVLSGSRDIGGNRARAVELQAGDGDPGEQRAQQMAKTLAKVFVKDLEHRLLEDRHPAVSPHTDAHTALHGVNLYSATAAPSRLEHAHLATAKASVPLQTLAGAERGRSGASQADDGSIDPDDPSPGFEPPVGREPLSEHATGVDAGMQGEETPFIAAIDSVLHEMSEITGDQEVRIPSKPIKETASLHWLPFGRDEIIPQPPTAQIAAHFSPTADETYRAFPDKVEPDSAAAAFRATDVQVPQPPASARLQAPADFVFNGTGAGGHWDKAFALQDFMDDQYVAQQSVVTEPPSHRAHTDFDIQGLLPDVKVIFPSSREYPRHDLKTNKAHVTLARFGFCRPLAWGVGRGAWGLGLRSCAIFVFGFWVARLPTPRCR
jgi:hypothetical protein